ncbi:unnamed protein product, partial [Prorocentrum cordatum]
ARRRGARRARRGPARRAAPRPACGPRGRRRCRGRCSSAVGGADAAELRPQRRSGCRRRGRAPAACRAPSTCRGGAARPRRLLGGGGGARARPRAPGGAARRRVRGRGCRPRVVGEVLVGIPSARRGGGRRPGGRLPISRLRLRRRGPCLRPLPARRRVPPSSGVHSARGSALGAPPDRTSLSGALGRLLPAPPPVAPRGHWPDRAEGGGPARRALCMPRWLRPRIGEAPSHRLPMRTSGSPRVACQAEAFFLDPPASRPGSAAGALSYPSVQELGGGGSWRDFGSLSAEHLSAWSFAAAFVPGFAVYLCVAICTYVYLCVRMCACMRMFAFTPVVYIAVCEMHGMRRNAGVPSGQHCRMNTRQHNAGRILFQAVSGQRVRSSV